MVGKTLKLKNQVGSNYEEKAPDIERVWWEGEKQVM